MSFVKPTIEGVPIISAMMLPHMFVVAHNWYVLHQYALHRNRTQWSRTNVTEARNGKRGMHVLRFKIKAMSRVVSCNEIWAYTLHNAMQTTKNEAGKECADY